MPDMSMAYAVTLTLSPAHYHLSCLEQADLIRKDLLSVFTLEAYPLPTKCTWVLEQTKAHNIHVHGLVEVEKTALENSGCKTVKGYLQMLLKDTCLSGHRVVKQIDWYQGWCHYLNKDIYATLLDEHNIISNSKRRPELAWVTGAEHPSV